MLESVHDTAPIDCVRWIVYSPKEGRTPIAYFGAYDGERFRKFIRTIPDDPADVPTNFGTVDAKYDNLFMADNYFERFLFMGLNASSRNLEVHGKSKAARRSEYDGETEYLGHKACRFLREGKVRRFESIFVPEPVDMVVQCKISSVTSGAVFAEFRVEELGDIDGVFYPSKGRYYEPESGRSYSFRVLSAEPLDERERGAWFPDWPGGTYVRDFVTESHREVPRTPAELKKLKESLPLPRAIRFLLIGGIVGGFPLVAIVAVLVWGKYRKRA